MSTWRCPSCGRVFQRQDQSHYCKKPGTVEEYISAQREEVQPRLKELRSALRAAIPEAEERISWSMPTYRKGKNLIHFAASKKHIGIYPGEEAVAAFSEELSGFDVSKGTIRLPYEGELPLELIQRLARWCLEHSGE